MSNTKGKPLRISERSRRRERHRPIPFVVAYALSMCCLLFSSAAYAFSTPTSLSSRTINNNICNIISRNVDHGPRSSTQLYNLFPKDEFDKDEFLDDDEEDLLDKYDPAVAAQIRKARQLLNDAKKKQKAKLEEQEAAAAAAKKAASVGEDAEEESSVSSALPFFATKSFTSSASVTSKKIKSKLKSGEIIADGETMASLSKSEPWERRSLSQMFEREARTDYDGNLVEGEQSDGKILADKDVARSIYNLRKSLQNEDFKKVFDERNRFIGDVD